jgi:hypothetical protein
LQQDLSAIRANHEDLLIEAQADCQLFHDSFPRNGESIRAHSAGVSVTIFFGVATTNSPLPAQSWQTNLRTNPYPSQLVHFSFLIAVFLSI